MLRAFGTAQGLLAKAVQTRFKKNVAVIQSEFG